MNPSLIKIPPRKSAVRHCSGSPIHPSCTPRSPQTPSLPPDPLTPRRRSAFWPSTVRQARKQFPSRNHERRVREVSARGGYVSRDLTALLDRRGRMAAINSQKISHGDNLAPGQTFTFTWNNPPWGKVVSYVAFPAVKSPGRGQVRRDAGRGDRRPPVL